MYDIYQMASNGVNHAQLLTVFLMIHAYRILSLGKLIR